MLSITGFTENPITALWHLYAVRYVTISGTAVLIYDTLLCLPQEISLVWKTLFKMKFTKDASVPIKILYLFARYTMIMVCIVALMMCMPTVSLSNKWCSNAVFFTGAADIILESIASGIVFYRLYKLWEFGSRGKWMLLFFFLFGKGIVWTFTFVNMARIDHTVFYVDLGDLRVCATTLAPRLALGVWIPDAILDISLVIFFMLNALSRPRLESQNLLSIIYKDGIQFFLTMICMRTINVVFTAFAPPSLFFIGTIFSGAMVTTVSSRVFLDLFSPGREYHAFDYYRYEDRIPMTPCRSY